MEEEEKKILLEIGNLQTELLEESINCNGYAYRRNARLLSKKVLDLNNEFQPNYLTISDIEKLNQTTSEQGERIAAKYEEVNRRNSPQIRKTELMTKINSANKMISDDIFSLLQIVREVESKK